MNPHAVPAELRARLAAVCSAAGLDDAGAQLVKFTNNAVFALPGGRPVVRIAGSPATHYRVRTVVAVAAWLAAHDFPAVRLCEDIPQPVAAGDDLATIWQAVPTVGPPPTTTDLGWLIRRWHTLPPPEQRLPAFDPILDIRARLDAAAGVADDDLAFLRARCDDLAAALAEQTWQLPKGPIHGDAHTGNLIPGAGGPILCDFDSACHGPREWDLAPVVFGIIRFGGPREKVDRFLTAYGRDVRDDPGFAVLLCIRELKLVASVTPLLRTNPGVRDEFTRRLRSLRDGTPDVRWHRYT